MLYTTLETLNDLLTNPVLLYSLATIVGLIVGSFLNVVILRLPRMMELAWRHDCNEFMRSLSPASVLNDNPSSEQSTVAPFNLAYPPSHCPNCQHRIRSWENIPILSYLILGGRCTACQCHISLRYPLIEASTALLTVIVIWQFGITWQGVSALVLTWGLIALAIIDFDTQLLPDVVVLPLLWLGLLLSVFNIFVDSSTAIFGAVIGYLSLWFVFHLFRLLTGKQGMGYGDFKLFAVFGAWLGWSALPQILLLSALPGAVVGIALIALKRQQPQSPLPFGPFLAIAGWIALLWGQDITTVYLSWSGLG
ncbi:prepilin peptidase [Thiospirillum jenense]|uniref:Prepilin leader peptidase/N-methyltransferase n=1 Tax=Thiospirillum jenense TaxID=1653858 RepID=A0A839HI37_9GAMM|nr:A24 family peptidase [Thiospirillum jenense]MBB1126419.1 prepilin peptidase [Thiospirillum jenense]